MTMFSIFQVSGSAMQAQAQRMNVAASNLANADSVAGPDGQPYRAREVVFQARGRNGQDGVGVTAITENPAPFRREYRPGDSNADAQGYVTLPNVQPVEEMVNMIEASRSYQANVDVMNTSKQLMTKTLTLGEN